ncbi:hypothetical protein RRSWK_02398 [Rhodopirellula sp. SWK7]|nr:hypothetical protein RRSWK_02398 [Rhodopirellula sp. SWK7]
MVQFGHENYVRVMSGWQRKRWKPGNRQNKIWLNPDRFDALSLPV